MFASRRHDPAVHLSRRGTPPRQRQCRRLPRGARHRHFRRSMPRDERTSIGTDKGSTRLHHAGQAMAADLLERVTLSCVTPRLSASTFQSRCWTAPVHLARGTAPCRARSSRRLYAAHAPSSSVVGIDRRRRSPLRVQPGTSATGISSPGRLLRSADRDTLAVQARDPAYAWPGGVWQSTVRHVEGRVGQERSNGQASIRRWRDHHDLSARIDRYVQYPIEPSGLTGCRRSS